MRLRILATGALALALIGPLPRHDVRARLPHDGHASTKSTTILYHGGPVMTSAPPTTSVHLYVIYYGRFATTTTNIIDNFLQNLGGSGAYGVNTTYSVSGQPISNAPGALVYNASLGHDVYLDPYSHGASMKGNSIAAEIQSVLQGGHLPADDNGIYILITSPDVAVSKSFCGYHTASTSFLPGHNIKYAFSPDPAPPNYNGCSGNISTYGDTTSPNGDVGADSVADTLIHEISETVTDPNLNAWFTQNGFENGDLCNFNYVSTFTAPNGSHANQTFGGHPYLVQSIWQNTGAGFCSLSH